MSAGESSGHGADWRSALARFDEWLALPEAGRAAWLAQLRSGSPAIAALVERMIAADGEAEQLSFLEGGLEAGADAAAAAALQGRRLGHWQIDSLIGSGGMGQVWLAHRTDGLYEGQAAIKLLRLASLDPAASERFALEGQLLGRLSHPHIARLLDAGVASDGSRYLVLEYIDGARIDDWCDAERLDLRARIQLFLSVCDAVAHAHESLVVHRDLKPSNIFVDRGGQVKLLDFGVAKLLDAGTGGRELTRELGSALTPQYAAPEQLTNGHITTATDVFGLGMVLYALLSGTRPWQDSVSPLASPMLTSPPRPLWTLQLAPEQVEAVAARRGTTVESLRKALRGDVAAVVGKAIRVDAAERYRSVSEFAADLRNVLQRRPVTARPDSALYRLRRYVRRHAVGVTASALVVVAVVTGATTTWLQQRAALREAQHAAAIKTFLVKMFEEARSAVHGTGAAREATLDDMLRAGATRVAASFESQPETRDEVYQLLVELTADTGDEARTTDLARARLAAAQAAFGREDRRAASAEIMLGGVLLNFGHFPDAQAALAHAGQVLDHAGDRTSLERAQLWRWQGVALFLSRQRYAWPEQPLLRAVELLQARFPDSDELLATMTSLPMAACRAGETAEALRWARTLSAQAIARYGSQGLYAIDARLSEASILERAGQPADAVVMLEQIVRDYDRNQGRSHPNAVAARFQLAVAYQLADRGDDSARALADADVLLARDHAGDQRLQLNRSSAMRLIQRHRDGMPYRCGI